MILDLHDEKEPCQDPGEEHSNKDNSRSQGLSQAEARCHRSGKKTAWLEGNRREGGWREVAGEEAGGTEKGQIR